MLLRRSVHCVSLSPFSAFTTSFVLVFYFAPFLSSPYIPSWCWNTPFLPRLFVFFSCCVFLLFRWVAFTSRRLGRCETTDTSRRRYRSIFWLFLAWLLYTYQSEARNYNGPGAIVSSRRTRRARFETTAELLFSSFFAITCALVFSIPHGNSSNSAKIYLGQPFPFCFGTFLGNPKLSLVVYPTWQKELCCMQQRWRLWTVFLLW